MNKKLLNLLLGVFLGLLLLGGGAAFYVYNMIYGNNIQPNKVGQHELFIPTGATYQQVLDSLDKRNVLKNVTSFDRVAQQMNYPNHIYAGRYIVPNGLGNRALINMLRAGKQVPFNITIHNIRTKDQLISFITEKLEADSTAFANLLMDATFLNEKQFDKDNVLSMFISDTYQFNWNTSAKEFADRMYKEYTRFWTAERKKMAEEQKLSPFEIIILASIVEEEVIKEDEMSKIAGVYYNRLRIGMALQADPTVKFAVGDFTLKRILTKHTEIDSPYNTYKYKGLPPGPIRIPSKKSLQAVLNPENHQYRFFCAKEDFSGYHNFAVTHAEHILNARRYQKELNRRNIR